jgi:hypothetical protein
MQSSSLRHHQVVVIVVNPVSYNQYLIIQNTMLFFRRKKNSVLDRQKIYILRYVIVSKVVHFLKEINGFALCVPCVSVLITVHLVACLGGLSFISDKAALLGATIKEMSFI